MSGSLCVRDMIIDNNGNCIYHIEFSAILIVKSNLFRGNDSHRGFIYGILILNTNIWDYLKNKNKPQTFIRILIGRWVTKFWARVIYSLSVFIVFIV